MIKTISSTQNPLIKQIRLLQDKSRERRKRASFVVEGKREVRLAIEAGYSLSHLLCCPEVDPVSCEQARELESAERIMITENVYRHLAYRGSTEGLIAVMQGKSRTLDELTVSSSDPLILVAEAPEKPGNIGALLRTADAAGVDAVIVANPLTDLFHPNIIRSSVGGVFTRQVATGSTTDVIAYLKAQGMRIYAATLQASIPYLEADMTGPTAIVVGAEATGLTPEWRAASDANIRIPMRGQIDSMNVSVAAGILIFEACRQRS